MTDKKVTDFIKGPVTYDQDGQYFWINYPDKGVQMLAELRGWGHIQHMFENKKGTHVDVKKAGEYQDKIGKFIADAINEKIEREKQ